MANIFNTLLVQPFFNILVVLYEYITLQDLGWAIILLTLLIRLVLYPLFYKGLKSQAMMQKIQPEIQKVQKQHKNNKEEQAKALMAVYKENKINPFSSFFYLLIQLPIIFAVYRVFLSGFTQETVDSLLYGFLKAPEILNNTFLNLIDLTEPSIIIVAIAVIVQYIQGRVSIPPKKEGPQVGAAKMGQYMVYIGPVLTLIILPRFSAAIGLYWLTTSLFSIFQQKIINKSVYGRKQSPEKT